MTRTICVAVAFMLATAVVQAINVQVEVRAKAQQMNVFKDRGEAAPTGTNTGIMRKAASSGTNTSTNTDASVSLIARSTLDSQADATKQWQNRRQQSIKLIVNSDVRYSLPLQTLFDSMENVSFHRWNDVVVMRGSASKNSGPFTPDTKYGKLGVKYIDLKLSSFDYHGFSGLHRHHNDPGVKADVYFYIHDTVVANSTFPSKFDSMASTQKFEARHPSFPSNNICVFGSGVVDAYGTQFDAPLTKKRGLDIEFAKKKRGQAKNVVKFAKKQTMLDHRIEMGYDVDVYHTGYPRQVVYFPCYGLTKYILFAKFGDLTGNVQVTML